MQLVTYVTIEYPADWKIGEEGKTDIGFIGDHTGDNISSKNASYLRIDRIVLGMELPVFGRLADAVVSTMIIEYRWILGMCP